MTYRDEVSALRQHVRELEARIRHLQEVLANGACLQPMPTIVVDLSPRLLPMFQEARELLARRAPRRAAREGVEALELLGRMLDVAPVVGVKT